MTYVDLTVRLLRDSARFFRQLADENSQAKEQLDDNADVYEQAAGLLEDDPLATIDMEGEKITYAVLAARMLRDAASSFRNMGEQNIYLKEQMNDNANVYEELSHLLEHDPLAEIDLSDQEEGDGHPQSKT